MHGPVRMCTCLVVARACVCMSVCAYICVCVVLTCVCVCVIACVCMWMPKHMYARSCVFVQAYIRMFVCTCVRSFLDACLHCEYLLTVHASSHPREACETIGVPAAARDDRCGTDMGGRWGGVAAVDGRADTRPPVHTPPHLPLPLVCVLPHTRDFCCRLPAGGR